MTPASNRAVVSNWEAIGLVRTFKCQQRVGVGEGDPFGDERTDGQVMANQNIADPRIDARDDCFVVKANQLRSIPRDSTRMANPCVLKKRRQCCDCNPARIDAAYCVVPGASISSG